MFGTIRKHQTGLWVVIIAVTCLSMVIYFQPGGKGGNQGPTGDFGSIDNKKITMSEMQEARNEAALWYYMRSATWPDSPNARNQFDWDQEADKRLFLIRKLEQYNIHSDPAAAAQLAAMILREAGKGQTVPLETFVDEILKPHNISALDFQHFLEHDISIQQLVSIIGASGKLVTPAEIQSLYVLQNQETAADVVFFTASNSLAKIPAPSPEALATFYTNQQAVYREPEQMQLSYVFFNVTNFLPAAKEQIGTNLNRMADDAMTRLGTNAFRFGKTLDEARTKIREVLVEDTAISNAFTKATDLQNAVMAKEPPRAENLNTVAKEKGFEVKVTKPFDKTYGPSDIDLGPNFQAAALFNLTAQDPFVDRPIRGADGVYILAFNKLIPSRVPPLEEIRSRVESDYKFMQAMRTAQLNGHVFAQTATNELAHGKTWAETCTATGVTSVPVAPFSLSSQSIPEVEEFADVGTFKEIASTNKVGSVSTFIPTREGGFVVHVKQRLPVDETKMKAKLPEFSKNVRQQREGEVFDLWFNQEASRVLRNLPAFQRPSTVTR
jgi:peptidyl-prolyl cis-trans isomerase D